MAEENEGGGAGGDGADEAVKRLNAKLDEVLGEKKKLAEKLRGFEASEAERKAAEAAREEEIARQKGDWEKIEGGYKTKLSEVQADAYLWRSRYELMVIDGGLGDALDAAKVSPALRRAAMALFKTEHLIDLDDGGKPTVGGKPLADFVAEWSKTDTGKAFVLNGSSGGGANGSGSGAGGGEVNPWDPAHRNLTEQGRLLRTDRAKAVRMAAQHGIRLT